MASSHELNSGSIAEQTWPSPTSPAIMMCPPDHYGIEYEINPWMDRSRGTNRELAHEQWSKLRAIIESLGATVHEQPPVRGLPDLVFTANAGLMWRHTVFLSRFHHEARQGETAVDDAWFTAAGYETETLPDGGAFEGAGDALFCGRTLFAGYLIRSDATALQWVGSRIGRRVIPLQLVDQRFYHVDTCFCPLDPETVLWFPPAFDPYGQRVVRGQVPRTIEVPEDEAIRFACNAVVIGRNVIHNTGCDRMAERLDLAGFRSHPTPLDEFIKAGGSAKCLTLRLDGEEAADWGTASAIAG